MKDTKLGNVGSWTDVYILGCFFYYVLSGGNHPFDRNDDQSNRASNIKNNKPNWAQHTDDKNAMVENYLELMEGMTSFNKRDRPTTSQILRHFDTKEYFPIYSDTVRSKSTAATRPGLCVIVHQEHFDNVSTQLYQL